tara:strand:- start:7219 stop:8406 length:1188 start_codon:yes stop_codon:yes gene_type:complete
MKICYLDCFSGISGDMLLGALIDAGIGEDLFTQEISKLGLQGINLRFEPCKRASIGGTNAVVKVAHDHAHRSLSQIENIITSSGLNDEVKAQSIQIFRRLGEVEAAIHQTSIEKVHFHEVGALDSIVDIVGVCIGFHLLDVEEIYCSPLNLGSGTTKAAHGTMPVPAPATAALVRGIPSYSDGPASELTTPTGAAIVTELAKSFGSMPAMTPQEVGYGAGDRDFEGYANLVRILVGETNASSEEIEVDVIEANVDDMTPQVAGYVSEQLLAAGALDVTLTPVFMKKGRPGFLISVLSNRSNREKLCDLIFLETTTVGVRTHSTIRRVLNRSWKEIMTKYGLVRIKVSSENGIIRSATPEYEDCRKIAIEQGVPLKDVIEQAKYEYVKNKNEKMKS